VNLGYWLAAATVVVAACDWWAVARRNRRAEYVFKPLALVVLIAAAVALGEGDSAYVVGFTILALVLSLAGDVFLMLPRNLFVGGLASFLLAHICYVAAFVPDAPSPGLAVIASVGVIAGFMYSRLFRGMVATGRQALAAPVGVYVLAISAMVVSALAAAGRADWSTDRSALAIGGALLFFCSDGMIGWSRFVRDFPGSRVAIMITYHLGQTGLVLALLG
jgi:alkenylglycerophosphocholine hydrolase